MIQELYTTRGENLQGTPWQVYPRPQLKRDSYLNLNGSWDFAVAEEQPKQYDKTILVPFCPECLLSGIHEHYPEGSGLWYRRSFALPEGFNRGKVLLHIGAADQVADVYVNGIHVGHHEGGYEAFCFDITKNLQEENELVICCRDDLNDQSFPYGKQVLPEKRGGIWYTPVSGIWQTVWLESVPEKYVEKLTIAVKGNAAVISTYPALNGKVIAEGVGEFALKNGTATVTVDTPRYWSPEDPYLYAFTLETGEDRIESYFALRTLEIKKIGDYQRLCLNGKPYFFHGLLDQGYWSDGLLTPPAPESYADDILAMKKLGFNTLRKHIKVEAEEFYYQCDKLGMIVWQDMVNNSDYNFFRDTAVPTARIQKLDDRKWHLQPGHREAFKKYAAATVNQLKNHPSICYWTIFNEGWGQFDSDNVYDWFRSLDSSRFIDSTSGWFRRKKSDVDSFHVYFRKVKLTAKKKPLVLSEFGGYSYKPKDHVYNPEDTYGYGKYQDHGEFVNAVEALYKEQIIPHAQRGLCAAIYTQVSDVQDETNGLLTYDRKVEKLNAGTMRLIAKSLQEAVRE